MSLSDGWKRVAFVAQDLLSAVGFARTPHTGEPVDTESLEILTDMAGDTMDQLDPERARNLKDGGRLAEWRAAHQSIQKEDGPGFGGPWG